MAQIRSPWHALRDTVPLLLFGLSSIGSLAADQPVVAIGPDGKPMVAGATNATGPAAAKPVPPGQTADSAASSSAAKPDAPTEPEPKVIRRDSSNEKDADPDELTATVGDDGRVAFQFRNQPWVEIVQWLADISDQPLDWLELPADRVNMRSPGRYTVAETQNLFNRHLLVRGFTLLNTDGGLTVAKTDKINPATVPRYDSGQLASLQPHTFVRTLVDVGWLSAEKLAEELKPMISSNGRLTALKTTNRIEAMDAAVNLMQIVALMNQERSSASREALAPEFKLRYLPAEEAKEMLEQFLGVEKKKPTPMTPQQMQMMQQQMRQRQQNQGQQLPQPPKTVEVSVVANVRQNSIIIRAPADRVAIAMEFLKRVDVPNDVMATLSDIRTRVQVFRLSSLDPEKLIEIVSEMNVLEPSTRIRADKDNNAIIVSGSVADRYIIKSLIERLDGSGRRFEVLPLRRLDPGEVAESIAFLMGKQEDKEDDPFSRRYIYSYRNRDDDKQKDEFRVAANSRYRQVLLWANEQEMNEVRSLLVKLGELPPPGGSSQRIRMIDASATPETLEYLKRLRRQWSQLAPNPLELPDEDEFADPNSRAKEDDSPEAPKQRPKPDAAGEDDTLAAAARDAPDPGDAVHLTVMQSPDGGTAVPPVESPRIRSALDFDRAFGNPFPQAESKQTRRGIPEPVHIEIDRNGNLIITSNDTDALDQLENLMLQIRPPKRPYHVFHIEHASATWVKLNLEDYYADMDEDDSSNDAFMQWYFGGYPSTTTDKKSSGLGDGAKLRIVADLDTNTLVVSGATPRQLATIDELIELWDVPEPVNKRKTRFTKLVQIKYGKAEQIAETVKEAYRDLLSSNDKSFANRQQPGGKQETTAKSRFGFGSAFQESDGDKKEGGGNDFSFKGKLSLGIDGIGNTLLVSAEGEPLLELVIDMIGQLDEAARPSGGVQVIEMPGNVSSRTLRTLLQSMGATSAAEQGDSRRPGERPSDGEREARMREIQEAPQQRIAQ